MKIVKPILGLFVFCVIPGLQRAVSCNIKIANYISKILDEVGFKVAQKLAKELKDPHTAMVPY